CASCGGGGQLLGFRGPSGGGWRVRTLTPTRIRGFLLSIFVAATSPVMAADCAGQFLFRPNDRLSIQELSDIGGSDSSEGPNRTILVAEVTDWEDTAYRDKLGLLAIVYGAFVGSGGRVIGGTLWVQDREAFGTGGGGEFHRAKDGVVLIFKPNKDTPIKGCKAGFTFRLDSKGVLYANGARVGQAQEGR
ncbi:MAG TPA: hypothetical protein VHN73_07335, partial [Phenylobacterium sp.]|nr:hypothetical protein [Phenylobacterium sp.]